MKMAKRPVPLYDFKAFGAAIKAARNEYGESRKKVSDELYISPRFWSSGILTGNQTSVRSAYSCSPFWSSGILTGNQTVVDAMKKLDAFWSSGILTGNQTLVGFNTTME